VLDKLAGQMIVLGTIIAQRFDRVADTGSEIGRTVRMGFAPGLLSCSSTST